MAIGGSTNAIVHLLAMAGRAGVELSLSDFDEISRKTPLITDLRPSGKFLMEDFYFAGGLPAVLKRMESILHMDLPTVNGKTLAENVVNSQVHNNETEEFGRRLLLARRLIERGVRFVQVYTAGWDSHDSHKIKPLFKAKCMACHGEGPYHGNKHDEYGE